MANRSRKPSTPLPALLVVLAAAVWLGPRLLSELPAETIVHAEWIGGLLLAGIVVLPILRWMLRRRARAAVFRAAEAAVAAQQAPLLRRRAQLVRLDPYGKPQHARWEKEIDYFITQHIHPTLTARQQQALTLHHADVAALIAERVEAAHERQPALQDFSDDMTSAEFETFCAEELKRAGWAARVTQFSGDQGADVIAEKAGRRVVLQCKLYARPVGNKAVQETVAARAHEGADVGIVVSNNRYTQAAEQLAATNGILLLHYRDLAGLEAMLGRGTNPGARRDAAG